MGNMYVEILAFVFTTSGFILVSSTMPTEYWKVNSLDGTALATATYSSNLWKMCVTDLTGVSNCKDFPSLLALDGYIQACRALMIAAIILCFFGSIFALLGMKCTKIGGSDTLKARIACLAGAIFIFSGLCSLTGCSLYAHQITSQFFDPQSVDIKNDLGAALFIGWGGSSLCIVGGVMFCFSIAGSQGSRRREPRIIYRGPTSQLSSNPRGRAVSGNTRPPPGYSSSSKVQNFDKHVYEQGGGTNTQK